MDRKTDEMKFTSIIMVHFAMNDQRSKMMRLSIKSLLENTHYPYELIVIDNSGSESDSKFLQQLSREGKIHCYIKNGANMHFGYARNQGIQVANGDYICIIDNDLLYLPTWLEQCIDVLEAYPKKKIYATPIYNVAHWQPKYWSKEVLEAKGRKYRLNRRAGSNCFVIRREDLQKIGRFAIHRVAGTKWTETAYSLGYWAAVTPKVMITDLGFRQGYSYKTPLPVKIELGGTGDEVYFNQDEYKKLNRQNYYQEQGKFL